MLKGHDEAARIDALRNLALLDTLPSESFDRITRMASQIFDLPIAAVSLTDTDRQWFKSRIGVDHWQIPRDKAPCAEVAETREVLVIPDMMQCEHYRDSLLAGSGIRFYAGTPLMTREGHGLGSFCVLGTEPRTVADHEMSALRDLAAMVMAQIELQHAFGRIDPVSGLPNRNQFCDDFEDLARDHAGERRCAVTIDLIDGAGLADALRIMGPSFVDDLIRASTRAMHNVLGRATPLYQVSTTQYAFTLDDLDTDTFLTTANAVRAEICASVRQTTETLAVAPVLGIIPFVVGEETPRNVLRAAHSAAQEARHTEAGVSLYSASLDEAHRRRFTLLTDMRGALKRSGELSLVYQPRIELASGTCIGAEALLRWNHPTLGAVSPAEFMPLVETTVLAREVTDWVVRTALAQVAAWRAAGTDLTVSLNVTASNLNEEDFSERLITALACHSLPSAAIEIELTEGALIDNGQRAVEQLTRIDQAGIKMAIDDFGTGYSSLSYLQRIPARVLKIDRSFMLTLEAEERTRTLVGAMISLAHDLGYSVVAEGVETEDVYRFLADHGCDEAQGYLISRPLAPDLFHAWLLNYLPGHENGTPRRLLA